MQLKDSVVVRKYSDSSDKSFIYSTWLKNYKHSSYFAKRIKYPIYFKGQHRLIDHIMAKPAVSILIASPKEDENTIAGYLVCELHTKPVIHFIYIKDVYRNFGVAKTLFKAAEIDPNLITFTHWTLMVDDLIKKYPDMIYDPYAI